MRFVRCPLSVANCGASDGGRRATDKGQLTMNTFWKDLRQGVRALLKQPAFTLVAVLTLALGIGANTAIFSVVNAVLLHSLPYRDADRLMTVWENNRSSGREQNVINLGNFFDWKEQNRVFEDMAT